MKTEDNKLNQGVSKNSYPSRRLKILKYSNTGGKWKKNKQTCLFPMQLVPIRNCDKEAIYHHWECITGIARTPCTQSDSIKHTIYGHVIV